MLHCSNPGFARQKIPLCVIHVREERVPTSLKMTQVWSGGVNLARIAVACSAGQSLLANATVHTPKCTFPGFHPMRTE